MATTKIKELKVESTRKVHKEITWEYVPILGNILGYYRQKSVKHLGDEIFLRVNTPLDKYDKIYINGTEIKIKE